MISERFADSKVDETSQIRQWHELIQDLLQLEPSNRSTCKQISDKLSAPALPPCSGKNTGTESSSKCAPKDKKNTSPNPMSQASRGPVSPPEVKGPKGGTEDNSSSLSPAMHVLPSRSTSPENLVRPPSSSASPENSVVSPRSKVLSPRSRSTSTSPVRFAQRVTGLISRLGNNAQNRTSPLAKDRNTKPSTDCDSGLLARTSSPARKLRSALAGQRLSRREPRSGHLTSSSDLLSDDQETPPPDSVSHASGSSLNADIDLDETRSLTLAAARPRLYSPQRAASKSTGLAMASLDRTIPSSRHTDRPKKSELTPVLERSCGFSKRRVIEQMRNIRNDSGPLMVGRAAPRACQVCPSDNLPVG